MKANRLAAVAMFAGLLILFAAPFVLGMLPASAYWTDADEAELQKASAEAHAAAYGGSHDHTKPHAHAESRDPEAQAQYDAKLAEYERHNARLKAAQRTQWGLTAGCRALGLLVLVAGLVLYVRSRQAGP
jgi:hypothetical protein